MQISYHFSLSVRSYRKSYCTTPGVGLSVGIDSSSIRISKILKLHVKVFLCHGQGTVVVVVVVVALLFYVHGKHLRSCRDGQLT